MAMGTYNPHDRYKPVNPMGNAGAMNQLLALKSAAFKDAIGGLDKYGQIGTRERVSDLLGTQEYQGMDRQNALGALLEVTKGRDLGSPFNKIIGQSDDQKEQVQDQSFRSSEADKAFGRQLTRDGINNKASMARAQLNADGGLSPTEKLLEKQTKDAYFELMAKTTDPRERSKLAQEAYFNGALNKNDRIALEKLGIVNPDMPAGGVLAPGSKTDKFTKSQRSKWPASVNKLTLLPGIMNKVNIGKDGLPYINGKVLTEEFASRVLNQYKK
jgi:hypothetical protein